MKITNSKSLGSGYTTLFREYDPEIARWKSLDPKLKDFPSESPFSAMGNNPIMNTDVLGDNFKYTIENNTITINVNIYLNDSQFKQRKIHFAARKANDMWNNDGDGWQVEHDGETYTVLVNVKFIEGHANNIGNNNMYHTNDKRAAVKASTLRDVYANKATRPWSIGHEIGHLLGLTDKYKDKEERDEETNERYTVSYPLLGWDGNVMAEVDGSVELRNIQRIVTQLSDDIQQHKQTGLTIKGNYNALSNSEAAQEGFRLRNSDKLNADHYVNSLSTPW